MNGVTSRALAPPAQRIVGTLFEPRESPANVAVVTIGGSDGGELRGLAERLAGEGFASLALTYFGAPTLPPRLQNVSLEYFRDAADALRGAALSRPRSIVLLGVSRGSEAALLTAIHLPDSAQGVVGVVPGNVTLCGWPPGPPAWLVNGEALPFVGRFGPYTGNPEAEIPVERIPGRILLISAGADGVWPSTAMAREMVDRLNSRGHAAGHLWEDYPRATHALGRLAPEPDRRSSFTDWPADTEARSKAWARLVEFLRSF